jgi:hypothetical protein
MTPQWLRASEETEASTNRYGWYDTARRGSKMKSIKAFGLLAVAALVVTAFATAGSASATTLCKENSSPCPAGYQVSLPTTLQEHAPVLTLSSPAEEKFNCGPSDMTFKVEKNLGVGKGLSGQVSSLSTQGCEWSLCQAQHFVNLPYHAEIHETTAGNGTLTLSSGGSGNPGIEIEKCGFNKLETENCTFGASKIELDYGGAAIPTTVTASKESLTKEKGGSKCITTEWRLGATYAKSSPFSASTKTSALIEESKEKKGTVSSCESSMTGTLPEIISNFTFSNCATTGVLCPTNSKAINLPYAVSTSGGGMTISSSGKGIPVFELSTCLFGAECKFGAAAITLDIEGGNLVAKEEVLSKQSGPNNLFCPPTVKWNATYSYSVSGSLMAVVSSP